MISNSHKISSVVFVLCLVSFCVPGFSQEIVGPASEVISYEGGLVAQGEALVQFKTEVTADLCSQTHDRAGCRAIQDLGNGLVRVQFTGRGLAEVLATYNRDSRVAYAEPNRAYRFLGVPNDPNWSQQWGPQKIRCAEAWDHYTGTDNVIIAVLDSGVDMDHPDLQANLAYAKDNVWGGFNPVDLIGHGTHTSGTAAGSTNNNLGIAGVAHDCDFAMFKVGEVIFIFDNAVIDSINDAIDLGHHVISMSFGGTASSTSMENALNDAHEAGIVCVAAAGNDGVTTVNYPAGYSSVIAVASSSPSDGRSSFSNYGNWVDVAAPGQDILSTYNDGGYTSMDGTSMACPHVAGMAGILYGMLGGTRSEGNADLIRSLIEDGAQSVGTWVQHGRVDLRASMDLAVAIDPPWLTTTAQADVGAVHTWTFGGGVGDGAILMLGKNNATFPYDGFDILLDLPFFFITHLDGLGIGSRAITIPANAAGKTFYGQVITFDEENGYDFVGASSVESTSI